MKDFFKIVLLGVLAVAALFSLMTATLGWNRVAAPFAEETRRQTYESSRSYNQGMAVDLDALCRERRESTDETVKTGLADTIRLRASRYTGELPSHVQRCVEEVR